MSAFRAKYGIEQVLGSIGGAMGIHGFHNALGLPESQRFALVLVDGMGLSLLEQHQDIAPFLSRLESVQEVGSAIPSTTSVNLTSLGTSLQPGTHGMAGYTCRIPGTTKVLNTLRWDPSVKAEDWQPRPTSFETLSQAGVHVAVLNKEDFEFSGLTRCSQRGVPYIAVEQAWDRLIAMAHESEQGGSSLVFGYESSLDFAGHAFGVDSQEWREALSTIDADLAELSKALPPDVVLVVTADHGMIDIPMENRFDVVNHPELLEDIVVFAGEARFRHLHTRAGAEALVAERWASALGDLAVVKLREDCEDWFGPIDPRVAPRFGDVVVASLNSFGVFHSEHHGVEMHMRGFHGSITDVERRIPVLYSR